MDNNWMGRYRPLIEAIVLHSHLTSRANYSILNFTNGISMKVVEWQVLEYLYEHEAETKMADIYNHLGIPQSTFSTAASTLCRLGLAEKCFSDTNHKNRIVLITDAGKELYENNAGRLKAHVWDAFFDKLKTVSDDDLTLFTEAIEIINNDMK